MDIIIVKTADLPEGAYNCSLYNGYKMMFNSKIIVKNSCNLVKLAK
jgi:hypothetical protein